MKSHKNRGFTLIEILIVVAIIALLIVMAIGVYLQQLSKGYDARRKSDLDQIKVALEEYEKDHDCYPTAFSCTGEDEEILRPYLNDVPCDPRTGVDYVYHPSSSGCPSWYWIFSSLDSTSDPDSSKLGCAYGCGPSLAYSYYVSSPNAPMPDTGTAASSAPSGGDTYYGCVSGSCQPLTEPLCSPNWKNVPNCDGHCSNPVYNCVR